MRTLASRQNPFIKGLVKLKGAHGREKEGRFLVEGVRLVEEALRARVALEAAVVAGGAVEGGGTGTGLGADPGADRGGRLAALLADLERAGVDVVQVPAAVLRELAETETPQGVIAVARESAAAERLTPADLVARPGPGGPPLIVILDGVQDPGNVGTVLRSAEAFGAGGVVAGPGTAALRQPKVLRASMGAAFRVATVETQDAAAIAGELAKAGLTTIAAVAEGGERPTALDLRGPVAVIVGNEGRGVSPEWLALVDRKATITMPGPTESLNASVAASILLYEVARQRGLT
ncbi:MAG: TrmH family RNA methyltransferase [Bacillota bacterium]